MKTSRKVELPPLPLVHNLQVTLWVGRHYPVRRPRCTFLRLIKHIFFVIQAFVFSKSCKDLKLLESCNQLLRTSAIVWTHYEFPLVFHAANTIRQCVAEPSPQLYYVTVQLIWPDMLHQRLHLKKNTKKHAGTETALPAIFCDVIMSATSVGRVCSARAPLEIPKERKKLDTFNPSTKPR